MSTKLDPAAPRPAALDLHTAPAAPTSAPAPPVSPRKRRV